MFRLIIDTETCGSLDRPLVYDFGGVVVDSDFNIVDSFDYVIRDIFFERRAQMETAYYANKLPSYFMDIANGIRKVVSFKTATDNVNNLISKYNISEVWAYNAIFDTKALNNTISVLSNGFVNTYFNGVTVKCIMAAFKQVAANSRNYFKCAIANGQVSNAGNIRLTAESAYQYFSGENDFVEAHTALADAEIEAFILSRCIRRKRKIDATPRTVNAGNYYDIQKHFKEYYF